MWGWTTLSPHVKLVRVQLQCFAELLLTPTANDGIHFELLFDIASAAREATAQSAGATTVGFFRVAQLLDVVNQFIAAFAERRRLSQRELRTVSIMEREWSEDGVGPSWFKSQEDGKYCHGYLRELLVTYQAETFVKARKRGV